MIYVVTHKEVPFMPSESKGYVPIQVGATGKPKLYDLTDDKDINISEKNASFCELTAIYWLWKNSSDETIGIVHYLRYFIKKGIALYNRLFGKKNGIVTLEDTRRVLQDYDIILPKRIKSIRKTAEERYGCRHNINDLHRVREIIEKKYPDYMQAYYEAMNSHQFWYANMLICKKSVFDQYCEWLFDILFELEKEIDISQYDAYQRRVFGFLSERMLGIWVIHNKLKVYEYPVINTDRVGLRYILKDTMEYAKQVRYIFVREKM